MDILKKDIREPIVSGLFYPDDPDALKEKVSFLLEARRRDERSEEMPESAQVILSPHGSWEQCGRSIAAAFASVENCKPRRILLMGPVHREKKIQKIYLPAKKYFDSPLGLVSVDQKSCKSLNRNEDIFCFSDSPHMEEHCLELQLPFIQTLFPDVPIIPLLSGHLKRSYIKKAAKEIREKILNLPGKTLIVVTANLSRYALLADSGKEAETLLNHINMPLTVPLGELEKKTEISSCGTVLFTLLSDLSLFSAENTAQFQILNRQQTEVRDEKGTMAVYYAGGRWK